MRLLDQPDEGETLRTLVPELRDELTILMTEAITTVYHTEGAEDHGPDTESEDQA